MWRLVKKLTTIGRNLFSVHELPGEIERAGAGHVEHVCYVERRQQLSVVGVVLVTDVQVLGQARRVVRRARLGRRVQYLSHAVYVVLVVVCRLQFTTRRVVVACFQR